MLWVTQPAPKLTACLILQSCYSTLLPQWHISTSQKTIWAPIRPQRSSLDSSAHFLWPHSIKLFSLRSILTMIRLATCLQIWSTMQALWRFSKSMIKSAPATSTLKSLKLLARASAMARSRSTTTPPWRSSQGEAQWERLHWLSHKISRELCFWRTGHL